MTEIKVGDFVKSKRNFQLCQGKVLEVGHNWVKVVWKKKDNPALERDYKAYFSINSLEKVK